MAATAKARGYRTTKAQDKASTAAEPTDEQQPDEAIEQAWREAAEAAGWLPEGVSRPEELVSRSFVRLGLYRRPSRGNIATSAGVTSWKWLTSPPLTDLLF